MNERQNLDGKRVRPSARERLPVIVGLSAGAVLVACVTVVGGASALDVNDDEAVLGSYEAASRYDDLDARDVCINTDDDFPGVAIVGLFAHDRGCMLDLVYVDGDWLSDEAAAAPVLASRGWDDADAATRAALVLEWIDFGPYGFVTVRSSGGEDFEVDGAPAFVPPTAEVQPNGDVVATFWYQEEAGMLPETNYRLIRMTFNDDGRFVGIAVLDDHTVQY